MINEIARFIARAIPDCTAEEIADILWLPRQASNAQLSPSPMR